MNKNGYIRTCHSEKIDENFAKKLIDDGVRIIFMIQCDVSNEIFKLLLDSGITIYKFKTMDEFIKTNNEITDLIRAKRMV